MATAKAQPAQPAPEPVVVMPAEPTGPTPTPLAYSTGSIKQDPVSLAVAVRTNIPDPYLGHAWAVMTVDRGGHFAAWEDVQNWEDVKVQ
jgi:hypothetical protein